MNSHFMLLASVLAIVVGDSDVEIVNVTRKEYGYPPICAINYVDHNSKNPSHLHILNADARENITHFIMTEGHYAVMPLNLFQLFTKLEKLEISTGLEAITKENLSGGNKLKYLILSENKIRAVKAHTFDGMDKLKFLGLHKNKLTTIESNAFAGAINLNLLDLSWNEIDTIEDGALNIPTLEGVDLSYNKLQILDDDVFVGCPELKTVSLDGNELTRIGKSFDSVPKLTWLALNNKGVNIFDFDFYAIARKSDLKYFFARSVALLLDDPASAANGNYTVESLSIGGNGLTYPDILHRLRNFRNLTILDIGNNNFTTINDIENILEIFPDLQHLRVDQLPCKVEVIDRLQTKFGDKIKFSDSEIVSFSQNAHKSF